MKVKSLDDRIKQLHELLKGYPGLLRVQRFSQHHFRLQLTPRGSPYVYRADYWPSTGSLVLLDDGKQKTEFAANPRQALRRLIMYAGVEETIAVVKDRYCR